MARSRAKLSDKEEKILVQAQLMGLTTESMVRIGNRLRALDKERKDKAAIAAACHGITQEKLDDKGWKITVSSGHVLAFTPAKKNGKAWTGWQSKFWNIAVTKPGTRYTPKEIEARDVYQDYTIPNRLCPENSRELYSLILFASGKDWGTL